MERAAEGAYMNTIMAVGMNKGICRGSGGSRGSPGSLGQRGRLWRESVECKGGIKSRKVRARLGHVDFRQEQSGKCKLILRSWGNTVGV